MQERGLTLLKGYKSYPKVVVMGGGTGLSVILNELKHYEVDITAIINVSDDGGSSGRLREMTKNIPPGDIRNVIVSLSKIPDRYKEIFQYRFANESDSLAGHALGNLILAAMADLNGNYFEAIQLLSHMMMTEGKVLPVSECPLTLVAQFSDGTELFGETAITSARKPIKKLQVIPTNKGDKLEAGRHVLSAIKEADLIVLGPGSLYTSILPNLLIPEVGRAVIASDAQVLYICNIMTQKGETENFSDADHVRVLHDHLGQRFVDVVLVNSENVPEELFNHPKQDENLIQVRHEFGVLNEEIPYIISDNFLDVKDNGIFHDGRKIALEIYRRALDVHYQLKSEALRRYGEEEK